MEALGALLAAYHDAAESVGEVPQRPIAFPVAELDELCRPQAAPDWLIRLCEELHERLAGPGITHGRRLVIHGDFTAHNVLAAGKPPRPVGVIDFGLAHVEDAAADLAFGLWRSGRPHQDATWLDVDRVTAFVGGYAQIRPLAPEEAALIPVYLWGRGVQMLAKAALRDCPPESCPEQINWLRANERRLTELIAASG